MTDFRPWYKKILPFTPPDLNKVEGVLGTSLALMLMFALRILFWGGIAYGFAWALDFSSPMRVAGVAATVGAVVLMFQIIQGGLE